MFISTSVMSADTSTATPLAIASLFVPLLGIAIPIFVAYARGVVNKGATIILSILLGWTCIGAIVPLIVAVTARTQKDVALQASANAAAQAAAFQAWQQQQPQPPAAG